MEAGEFRIFKRIAERLERSPESVLRALAIACGVAALILAVASYHYGRVHRFDHWIAEGIEYENVKVAAALSKLVYGFDRGYLAQTQVYDALRQGGMTIYPDVLAKLGTKYPDNMSDAGLLNKALKDASSLKELRTTSRIITDLKPVEPNDLGLINYYAVAFELFGIKIQAFYRLYYLLHLASIALFALAYWRRAEAMAALLAVCALHLFAQVFLVGGVEPERVFGVATPYNQRFVAVLGVVSALHVALALWWRPRASPASAVALLGQVAILFFVSSLRLSGMWEVLWAGSAAAAFLTLVVLSRWNLLKRWQALGSAPDLLRRGLSWQAVTFGVLFAALSAAHSSRADPIYRFSDEFLPRHMFWHSMVVGLSAHPEWSSRYAKRYINEQGELQQGDSLPITATQKWLKERYNIPGDYLISPIWGYRYRTLERVAQEVFFEFVRENPGFFLELQLVHKPLRLLKDFARWNLRTAKALPLWVGGMLAAALALFAACYLALGRMRSPFPAQIAGILAVGAAVAILPAVVIFPSYSNMSDQALILDAALLGWIGWALAAAAARRRPKPAR